MKKHLTEDLKMIFPLKLHEKKLKKWTLEYLWTHFEILILETALGIHDPRIS